MSQVRAALHTIKSLKALSKVCSRSRNSLDSSIKTLSFVKNLSTLLATDERSDFQHPDRFGGDNYVEHPQNPSGVSSDSKNVDFRKLSIGYGQDWSYRGNNMGSIHNPDGFYGGNSQVVQQNPSGVYGQNHGLEYQQKVVGQSGSYSNNTGINEFQGNIVEPRNGNCDGYCGNNSGELSQNPIGLKMENSSSFHRSSNGLFGENKNSYGSTGQLAGSANGRYGESGVQFQHRSRENYMGNNGWSQQNSGNYNMDNVGASQQSSYNYYTENPQHGKGDCYWGNTAAYQQRANGFNGESVGSGHGFLGKRAGQYQENPNDIYNSNAGTNQQYPTGTYNSDAQYPSGTYISNAQYPNGTYNSNTGTYEQISNNSFSAQVSSNTQLNEESIEAAESRHSRGSIEEFDDFCKEGKIKEAVEVLGLLEQQHIAVDVPRYLMLMKECGEAKALQEAKYVHEHLVRSVSHLKVSTYNKILEMYLKCGSVDEAYMIFHRMPQRNLTSWDNMITWLAKNGLGEDAIEMFTEFKQNGLKPDSQMFFGVFSACSVLGDINEGLLHFESMSKNYGIVPSMEHYVSVVDMLGSTGYLDEALEFVEKMPMEPSVGIWETLMNLCRVHGKTDLGDHCAEFVELLEPSRLDEQSKVGLIPVKASDLAKEKEKKKLAGQNPLEARNMVHDFRAGDTSHPNNDKLYALLRGMKQQLKEAGYVPETKFVLHDIDQEGKEEALLAHSERLAVSQGLLSSPARSPMRIIKNLRVCGDCHNALKFISKLVGRELIIRDAKRFHHFKDGLCSCNDYW